MKHEKLLPVLEAGISSNHPIEILHFALHFITLCNATGPRKTEYCENCDLSEQKQIFRKQQQGPIVINQRLPIKIQRYSIAQRLKDICLSPHESNSTSVELNSPQIKSPSSYSH
ncbi:hypothetical protein HF882_04420 [Victivallis vadensis]|uniref:Uncharacterized protein n=1 Tax=Victivallis vadensis TaxID=172901 RepID=A0A848APP1_9BACT|nr:hypothetical protein [Victivallis vadensis]NMD85824.1 hypothetical protein [Victivallis vadensis]